MARKLYGSRWKPPLLRRRFLPSYASANGTASGATLTATASLIDGTASGTGDVTANGATLTATASLIDGAASGVQSPTVAGQILTAVASLIAGSAYGPSAGGMSNRFIGLRIALGL